MTLCISGITGRMGKLVEKVAKEQGNTTIIGVNSTHPIEEISPEKWGEIKAIIDFSVPENLEKLLYYSTLYQIPLVLGTTGYTKEQKTEIEKATNSTTIIYDCNFSPTYNTFAKSVALFGEYLASQEVPEQGTGVIIEGHHRHKKDIPSGTALHLHSLLPKGTAITAWRQGEEIGTHQVILTWGTERVTLTHEVFHRESFARGALNKAVSLI